MLAAALLSFVAPSKLDQALEEAATAMRKLPTLHVEYGLKFDETEDLQASDIRFRHWKEGGLERYDVREGDRSIIGLVKNPPEILAVSFLDKTYARVKDDLAQWEDAMSEGRLRPEPGSWIFLMTPTQELILRATPPFEVTGDKVELWKGNQVRLVEFRSNRKGTKKILSGRARFDSKTGYFLSAQVDSSEDPKGKYEIDLLATETKKNPPNFFKIDISGISEFRKLLGPKIDL
ncbi:hypothetical protein EON81_08110 [bacterium]|nr:MAG: hypothetical protein EON81_08110 [bacterium]